MDPVLKAAFAHLWFVTIHPFEDGNGRITRAITDMQLARADQSKKRFYSMSAQIQAERDTYYAILESTQKGDLDITDWLVKNPKISRKVKKATQLRGCFCLYYCKNSACVHERDACASTCVT
ncbi:Fic family protein [Flavobacterium sp. GSP27]|uniref:Fic family protein n=1 Tax=Flavobacterium sp. GSP27 TaxID=2497489 RepID=UPI002100AAF9|nr:Fic family protein [Flavobacterium sp. GSP27]